MYVVCVYAHARGVCVSAHAVHPVKGHERRFFARHCGGAAARPTTTRESKSKSIKSEGLNGGRACVAFRCSLGESCFMRAQQ